MKKLLFLLLSPLLAWAQASPYLEIKESDVLPVQADHYGGGFFDEGPQLLDSEGKLQGKAKTSLSLSYQALYQPQSFLVDLRGTCSLDSLLLFDGSGSDSLGIWIGKPGQWQSLLQIKTDRYRQWRSYLVNKTGAYLLLQFASPQSGLSEILIYGKRRSQTPNPKPGANSSARSLSFGEFIGLNAFVDDPLFQIADLASSIREYHNWGWHYDENSTYQQAVDRGLSFSPAASGPWDFDQFYRSAQQYGIKVYPCLQGSPSWLATPFDHKPILQARAANRPESYREFSSYCFQFAARYGAVEHPPQSLNLAPDQKPQSGLNLIAGLEAWNEPDKWWRGRGGYFNPFEYAAFLSAAYDGHQGELGRQAGAKNAAPHLEFIMGGLTRLDTQYLEAVRIWAIAQRPNRDFPADALNFHHYSNDGGGQSGTAKHGISPEADHLEQRLKAILRYRDRKLPTKKVYLSEFGYDSNPQSQQAPNAKDSLEALEKQANYLCRSFLLAHASGIDGAFLYMYRDVNTASAQKYSSSGLSREKWNRDKLKPSFFKLRSLNRLLGEFHFVEHISTGHPGLICLHYKNARGAHRYALWNKNDGEQTVLKTLRFLDLKKAIFYPLKTQEGLIPLKNWQEGQPLTVGNSPLIISLP